MNLENICRTVINLARNTGQYIKSESTNFQSSDIEKKGKNDFVTHVDKGAEKKIIEGLQSLIPEAGFIAEEGTSTKRGDEYNWIIDPIDGTTNFIHGVYPHAISIALDYKNEIILGVIYEIGLDECFYSWKGAPAYLNDHKISVSDTNTVSESLIATGFPYANYSKMNNFMKSLDFFMKNSHGLRRLGSAATDLAYVACGRFEAFYEYDLKPWDVAAGAFLVQQAGGKNCDFNKGNNYIYGKEIISSNNLVFEELSNVIYSIMNNNL